MRLMTMPQLDRHVCMRLNRWNHHPLASRCFGLASRLGDGVFWYTLMLSLPLAYGWGDGWLSLRMAITGLVGTMIYKALKSGTQRPRPCEVYATMLHRTVEPLDRFSFPSGHTLHAVSFTCMASAAHPELGWFLIPFTLMVAASRMILGLHYPSDVMAGAAIGAATAVTSNLIAT